MSVKKAKLPLSLPIHRLSEDGFVELAYSSPLPSNPPTPATPNHHVPCLENDWEILEPITPSNSPVSSVDPPQPASYPRPENSAPIQPGSQQPNRHSELKDDLSESELYDLPAGFPYTDWQGVLGFAWEYIQNMQRLLTELMEGSGRYHGIRHTT